MGPLKVPVSIYQYAKYVREMVEESCPLEKDGKPDVEQVSLVYNNVSTAVLTGYTSQCFGSFDPEPYKQTGIDQKWRLWLFQGERRNGVIVRRLCRLTHPHRTVCENWGYFMPAPLDGKRIISKLSVTV